MNFWLINLEILEEFQLNKTVLENLKDNVKIPIKEVLVSHLKHIMLKYFRNNKQLQDVVRDLDDLDIISIKDTTLQSLLTQIGQKTSDKILQQNLEKFTTTAPNKTISEVLGLTQPIKNHPLFKNEVDKTALRSLVATAPTMSNNPSLQKQFVNLYINRKGSIPDFWNKLSQDPSFKDSVKEIQLSLQLGLLTLNNVNLIKEIQSQMKIQSMRDLTNYDTRAWTKIIKNGVTSGKITLPGGIPGKTPNEKITNYVSSITSLLQSAFPTPYVGKTLAIAPAINLQQLQSVFALNPKMNLDDPVDKLNWGKMSDDDKAKAIDSLQVLRQETKMFPSFDYKTVINATVDSSNTKPVQLTNSGRKDLVQFFTNAPDFDFRTTNIDSYIASTQKTTFQGIRDTTNLVMQLKRMQRILQLVPGYQEMSILMGVGLHSAHSIVGVPRELFVRQFSISLGGEDATRRIYAKAEYVHGACMHVFTNLWQAANGVNTAVIS